jgi:nitrate/nitrite transporter NarK
LVAAIFLFAKEPKREKVESESSREDRKQGSLRLITGNKPLVMMIAAYSVATFASVGMMQWLPQFFIRSHGISTYQLSVFFGPVLGGGLITGMLLGGWIGNRVASRSVSGMVRLCAWIMFLLIPLFLAVFLVSSMTAALVLTFVTMAVSVAFSPMAMAAWQTICDARIRGTTMGIVSFAGAVIGGAVCPFLVGVFSDLLSSKSHAESLRYALIGGMAFVFMAGCLYYYSSVLTKRHFERLPEPA